MKTLAVLMPTYQRPHHLAWIAENLRQMTPASLYQLYFIIEPHDEESIRTAQAIEDPCVSVLIINAGSSNRALNMGCALTFEPYIYNACDDLEFTPGWAERMLKVFKEEPTARVVSSWDGFCVNGKSGYMLDRNYVQQFGTIDEPGKIMHEYHHYYADEELMRTAMHRKVFHASEVPVLHHHPALSSKYSRDATYERAESTYSDDAKTYETRRHLFT